MPTSTNVTNLKINQLTEAQYDAAVQGGVIGVNELSFLTDAEAGQVIQVATLPTASADELGKIYQFVGTTDANYTNGYFYKCTGAGEPVVYSWSRVDVQPAGLVNTATGTDSLSILGTSATNSTSINIGTGTSTSNGSSQIVIGNNAGVVGSSSNNVVVIGANASVRNANMGIALGSYADANATHAIQLGSVSQNRTTNSDANTFKVANANGNFEIMSADGTIPSDRLTKVNSTITLAAADWSSNTQTVNVTGMTATGVVMVSPDPTDQSAYTSNGILCTAQAAGTLTFTCDTVPSADIDVNVVML